MIKRKTNLLFYNGKLRTLGAIWRGIWNVEGTGMSKVECLRHRVCCKFGRHSYTEGDGRGCYPGPIYCEYCDKLY
jgi:hypothetical protein